MSSHAREGEASLASRANEMISKTLTNQKRQRRPEGRASDRQRLDERIAVANPRLPDARRSAGPSLPAVDSQTATHSLQTVAFWQCYMLPCCIKQWSLNFGLIFSSPLSPLSFCHLLSFCGAMVQFKKTEPERAARTLMQNIAVATSKLSISLKANRVVV